MSLKIKPEIREKLGERCNQIECSLKMLATGPLTENQQFHLRQLEQVLCAESPLEEEPL